MGGSELSSFSHSPRTSSTRIELSAHEAIAAKSRNANSPLAVFKQQRGLQKNQQADNLQNISSDWRRHLRFHSISIPSRSPRASRSSVNNSGSIDFSSNMLR